MEQPPPRSPTLGNTQAQALVKDKLCHVFPNFGQSEMGAKWIKCGFLPEKLSPATDMHKNWINRAVRLTGIERSNVTCIFVIYSGDFTAKPER